MKTALLVFTFNEITGLKEVMPKLKWDWVDEIIVIDGGSTDGSLEYAKDNGYRVIVQKKRGLRHAYTEALETCKADIVIPFSPDGNSIPEFIPPLIQKMKEGYDMVIVSRYAKGAKSYDDDIITAFGNRVFTFLINSFFSAKYTDALVMFRAWKRQVFYTMDLDKDESFALEEKLFFTKLAVEPLLSIRAAKKKLKCADIPGDEPARIGGERKMRVIQWGGAYLFEVFRELFFWKKC